MSVKEIKSFAESINRGPFKQLKRHGGHCPSAVIIEKAPAGTDIYDYAVRQAYLDMCRTVRGAGAPPKNKRVQEALEMASRSLRDYFGGKPKIKSEAFDSWMQSVLLNVGMPAKFTVGQSQKIINMAFKYLYCCDDYRSDKKDYFVNCHMPLDDYTLTWYKNECSPDWRKEAWSVIDDVLAYYDIQSAIREKLNGQNVLVAEFSIWSQEKRTRELIELKTAAQRILDSGNCDSQLRYLLESFSENLAV